MNSQYLIHLLHQHGALGLFVLLALGIFGLPIPDETLLVISGALLAKKLLFAPTIIPAAILGAMIGITLSYLLGFSAGHALLLRYGKYIRLTPEKLHKVETWFAKAGKWLLLFGYFLPGMRHLTGISAGAAYLRYRSFALFAYTGAVLWSLTFLSLGYFAYPMVAHYFVNK